MRLPTAGHCLDYMLSLRLLLLHALERPQDSNPVQLLRDKTKMRACVWCLTLHLSGGTLLPQRLQIP